MSDIAAEGTLPRSRSRSQSNALSRGSPAAYQKLTLKSLLSMHALDWVLFVVLVIFLVALHLISKSPYEQYINAEDLKYLMKPLLPNSVPSLAVPAIALGIPVLCFILAFLFTRDAIDLHQSTLGLLFAVAIAAAATDSLKESVGRPRPDFFWRCFPNGEAVFSSSGSVSCTGITSVINEGRRSFPSGHSSWSFSGLGFLALYISGKLLSVSPSSIQLWRIIPPLIPLVGATAVAVTRVDDYWHFPTDVIAGSLIGLASAALCYFRLYPALTSDECQVPRVAASGPIASSRSKGDGELLPFARDACDDPHECWHARTTSAPV